MKKKSVLTLMVIAFVQFFCFAFAALTPVKAESVTVDGLSELKMQTGAEIRVLDGELSAATSGIRFSFTVKADEYETLMSDVGDGKTYSEIKFGVFIAAANYNVAGYEIADESHISGNNPIYYWEVAKDANGDSVFNVENPDTDSMKRIICAEGGEMLVKEDGNAYFYGSAVNMKSENISREYVGVGYIKYTSGGETHYRFATENDNVRSMERVARIAYKLEPEYRDSLKTLYLNYAARDCEVLTVPAAIEGLEYNGKEQALITAGVSDDYSVMNYSLDGIVWSADVPVATEAGEYTVYYKAVSKTDFDRDSGVKTFTVTIAQPESNVVTLAAATVTEVKDGSTVVGYTGTYDYRGLGEYKVGDVLEFYFTGKSIPNVGLFVNKNGVNPIGGGTENTGLFLQTSGHGTETFDKRLYIAGPFLVDAGSVDAYRTVTGLESYAYKTELGKNKELGVDTSNPGFGIQTLVDGTDYVYRITTEAAGSAAQVIIKLSLYSVSGNKRTAIKEITKTVTHYLPTLENTYAAVYGTGDYYASTTKKQNISFSYEINPVLPVDTLTLSPATVTEVRDGSTVVGYTGTYDYRGLGEYKVGDVIEFSFTGKNIPNVGLFVNKNGVNPIGGGTENTGLFLQTSGHGTSTFDKRLYIAGPFLVDAGSADAYRTIAGLESYAYKTELGKNMELGVDISNTGNTSMFGIAMLEDGVDYVYRVTTEAADSSAQVIIKLALYSVSGEERTLLTEITKTVTHYLPTLENTYAVVYGAGDYSGRTITFTYELIKAE